MESNRDDGKLRLGFMGFGEAASRFAKDLSQAGLSNIFAYSPSAAKAGANDALRTRAAEAGVELRIAPVLEAIVEIKGGT